MFSRVGQKLFFFPLDDIVLKDSENDFYMLNFKKANKRKKKVRKWGVKFFKFFMEKRKRKVMEEHVEWEKYREKKRGKKLKEIVCEKKEKKVSIWWKFWLVICVDYIKFSVKIREIKALYTSPWKV